MKCMRGPASSFHLESQWNPWFSVWLHPSSLERASQTLYGFSFLLFLLCILFRLLNFITLKNQSFLAESCLSDNQTEQCHPPDTGRHWKLHDLEGKKWSHSEMCFIMRLSQSISSHILLLSHRPQITLPHEAQVMNVHVVIAQRGHLYFNVHKKSLKDKKCYKLLEVIWWVLH